MESETPIIAFKFKGLPYLSENYKGDKYAATRGKIKGVFSKIADVKKLYVNMDAGFGRVELDTTNYQEITKLVVAITKSPMKMIKFSWESPILEMKSEHEKYLPYKAWLFLDDERSYEGLQEKTRMRLEFEKALDYDDYLNREFEDEYEQWLLEQEIDEVLTNAYPDFEEDEEMEDNERKRKYIINFEESDDEEEEAYELVETFTPVSGKSNFTIQEICEHIRMLAVCNGKNELSVSELTEYFGQKREYKKVPVV
jgi:hypothetical protein